MNSPGVLVLSDSLMVAWRLDPNVLETLRETPSPVDSRLNYLSEAELKKMTEHWHVVWSVFARQT